MPPSASRSSPSSVKIVSGIRTLNVKSLRGLVPFSKGDWFDGDALQEAVTALNNRALNLGYAFAQVNPDVQTD
ncbi:MAG: POTRA domain-containing protein, partial [Acidocella sp.]|uniref:POTRA domain-containing protein n=1 Tax=Acidocella sp. TaxID=50710 RepID=UPI003FD8A595